MVLGNRFTRQKRSHITEPLHRAPLRSGDRPSQQIVGRSSRIFNNRGFNYPGTVAPQDDFYIAWDGREYAGIPPEGWFLAADNRWWPPRDLIEEGDPSKPDSGQRGTPSPEHGTPENAAPDYTERDYSERDHPFPDYTERDYSTPTPLPAPTESQPEVNPGFDPTLAGQNNDPPASWAPTPTGGGAPEEPQAPGPQSPSRGRRSSRRKRGRQSRFRLGPILFFFFILSRCDGFAEVRDVFSAPAETGFVEAAAGDFTGTNGCSFNFLWGSITNDTTVRQAYLVTTAREDGGSDYVSDEFSVAAGETQSWVIDYPIDEVPDDFCPPVVVLVAP